MFHLETFTPHGSTRSPVGNVLDRFLRPQRNHNSLRNGVPISLPNVSIGQATRSTMRPSFPEKTNFVIHEGRRGDSVVYLISRLPGRTRKNLHQYRHRSRRNVARRGATIYRYSINHFGSYLGVLARDKSLNGRIPAKRDGTKRTIRMKYNGTDENFSGQKRARAFPRPRGGSEFVN